MFFSRPQKQKQNQSRIRINVKKIYPLKPRNKNGCAYHFPEQSVLCDDRNRLPLITSPHCYYYNTTSLVWVIIYYVVIL